jgi:hypothetical protein
MRKWNFCEDTGRSMGDTERLWGDTGKSGGDTEKFGVEGPGNIFGGTPGEDIARFGRSGRRSGMED